MAVIRSKEWSGTQWRTTHCWSQFEKTHLANYLVCSSRRNPPLLSSSCRVMDVDEWELLSEERFVDFDGEGDNRIFSNICSLDTDYFVCPSIQFKEVPEAESAASSSVKTKRDVEEDGQVAVSQVVYFKKMKENEFVDMKMDLELQFDGKAEAIESNLISSPRKKTKSVEMEEVDSRDEGGSCNGGLNVVRWGFSGFGAICSLGIAAATICIIFVGSKQKKMMPLQPTQKVSFQIYRDDKRTKKVVHHASKLKEAVSTSAMRGGAPPTGARITFGGRYNYDGLL